MIKTREAKELGQNMAALLAQNQIDPAYDLLAPVLVQNRFRNAQGRTGTIKLEFQMYVEGE